MKITIAIILNLALFILGMIGCIGEFKREKFKTFRFYTYDSNVVGTVAGLAMAVCLLTGQVPGWVAGLKFAGTCCLALTFLVVIFVLAPGHGPGGYRTSLLEGNMKYQHLLCPLLAIVSYAFADSLPAPTTGMILVAWSLTVIYAIVSVVLNVLKVMVGPYPFLHVYEQPWWASVLWGVGIVGVDLLLVWAI